MKNKNDRILITGATGFIGSHMFEHLSAKGYDVIGFDRYNSNNDWGWLENSKYINKDNIILGDIRDYDSVYNVIKNQNRNVVFHLAALIGIPYSYISPLAYIRTNIEGTYNVLEASKHLEVDQVLITSTSETYGSAQYSPIDERHPLVGQSPYAASKIAADQLSISYFRSFDLPLKIIRPFNTYGPRQSSRAVIPTVISQILSNEKNIYLGNIHPTRDLTFISDTCNAFFEIYKSNSLFGETTNIGMGEEISIGDLVKLISKVIGKNVDIISDNERIRPKKSEVDRLICDNSKLLNNTSWEPQYSLELGLRKFIDWIEKEENFPFFKKNKYNV